MDKVKNYARDEGLCLFLAADQLIQSKALNNRATNSLAAFLRSLNETKKLITEQPLEKQFEIVIEQSKLCLLYTSPSPRDLSTSRMPSSA